MVASPISSYAGGFGLVRL